MGRLAKRNAAFRKILEACKELGWTMCQEEGDGECRGLFIGTEEYVNEFDVQMVEINKDDK